MVRLAPVPAQARQFQEDGFIIVPKLFDAEEMALLLKNNVSTDEFGARIKLEMEKWGKVVRDAKLRIE
jgi:hypothetical protein